MTDSKLASRLTSVVCENVFTPAELNRIELYGDGLTQNKAVLGGTDWKEAEADRVRITRTAWIGQTPQTKWLYDRIHGIIRTVNDQVYQFDLRGFFEDFQYAVYHGTEGGHYGWHVDMGVKKMQRKLSLSLQLTDGVRYEGGDLQFYSNPQPDTAPRQRGTVIVFPSYVLHRVTPVTSGSRKSLVVWAAGPQFK